LGENRKQPGHWRSVAVLLGLALGAFSAYEFWPVASSWFTPETKPKEAKSQRAAVPLAAPVAPVPSDPRFVSLGTDSSLSEKPLPFVLVGTLPGRNATEGKAMLGTDARNAQTYLAGAVLVNGAKLAEIYRDRVILRRGSQRATLYLDGARGTGERPPSPADPLLTTGEQPKVVQYAAPQAEPVTDYIRFVPEYRDGVAIGIRVYPGRRSDTFQKWGFKPGDVVTSIDGTVPVDADEVNALLGELADGASLSARVTRPEGSVTVAMNGADIVQLQRAREAAAAIPVMPP
jgi:type II secretion system protein C